MKKNKKFILVICILIVCIIATVFAIFFTLKSKNEKSVNAIQNNKEIDLSNKEDILNEVKLVDKNKEIVYTLTKIKNFEFPAINIDSADVKLINSQIKTDFGFTSEMQLQKLNFTEVSYDYYINGKTLSILLKKGGNQNVFASCYNINLEDGSKLKNSDLLLKNDLQEKQVKQGVLDATLNEYKSVIEKDRSLIFGQSWDSKGYANEIEKSIKDYTAKVEKLENLYLNENNEVCMVVSFVHPGGQWMCTRSIIVNISNDYQVEELRLNNGEGSENTEETANKTINQSTNKVVTDIIEPDPSAYPSTPDAITQEQAIELLKKVYGTKSEETGFEIGYSYYAWVKDTQGKEYYVINMQTFNGTNWTWIRTICVAVDGSEYKQLQNQPTCQNGETIEGMLDGGKF